LASETDDQLVALRDYWLPTLATNIDLDDSHARFRTGLIKLAYSYARLVVLSFGFQRAGGKSNLEDNPFITRVWLLSYLNGAISHKYTVFACSQ
jgi:hypothetical protein